MKDLINPQLITMYGSTNGFGQGTRDTHPLTLWAPAQVGLALPSPPTAGGSDTPVASMLPGQLKLQPPREAPELFQRLQLLKNTHYTSEGIIDESTKIAAVVDPVEPEKVLKAAQEHGVSIKLILTTRHCWIYGCNAFDTCSKEEATTSYGASLACL